MSVSKILTHRCLLMVLQNQHNFKEMTSNMFYLLHLYSYIIKKTNLLNILKKNNFQIKKKNFLIKKKNFLIKKKNLVFKGISKKNLLTVFQNKGKEKENNFLPPLFPKGSVEHC